MSVAMAYLCFYAANGPGTAQSSARLVLEMQHGVANDVQKLKSSAHDATPAGRIGALPVLDRAGQTSLSVTSTPAQPSTGPAAQRDER